MGEALPSFKCLILLVIWRERRENGDSDSAVLLKVITTLTNSVAAKEAAVKINAHINYEQADKAIKQSEGEDVEDDDKAVDGKDIQHTAKVSRWHYPSKISRQHTHWNVCIHCAGAIKTATIGPDSRFPFRTIAKI